MISRLGLVTSSEKALLELGGFVLVFVLVGSLLETERQIRGVAQVLVLAAAIVAVAALYEFRTGFNAFHHLSTVLPGFDFTGGGHEKCDAD